MDKVKEFFNKLKSKKYGKFVIVVIICFVVFIIFRLFFGKKQNAENEETYTGSVEYNGGLSYVPVGGTYSGGGTDSTLLTNMQEYMLQSNAENQQFQLGMWQMIKDFIQGQTETTTQALEEIRQDNLSKDSKAYDSTDNYGFSAVSWVDRVAKASHDKIVALQQHWWDLDTQKMLAKEAGNMALFHTLEQQQERTHQQAQAERERLEKSAQENGYTYEWRYNENGGYNDLYINGELIGV